MANGIAFRSCVQIHKSETLRGTPWTTEIGCPLTPSVLLADALSTALSGAPYIRRLTMAPRPGTIVSRITLPILNVSNTVPWEVLRRNSCFSSASDLFRAKQATNLSLFRTQQLLVVTGHTYSLKGALCFRVTT